MAVDGNLIVLSYNPADGSYDRDTLKNYLKTNQRMLLRKKPNEAFLPYYIAETHEEADSAFITFRNALAGKFPKHKPTIAELLREKPKRSPR